MHRRIFLRNIGLIAGASLLLQQKVMAQLFRAPEFKIRMLRNNVGIFTERGGTIGFLLTDEGIVVVDSQFPDTAGHFMEEAKKLNTHPFKFLLNTHHHGDHTAGNIAFKGIVESVMAHQNSLANQKAAAERQNTLDKQLLPDSTFNTETKIKIGKEKITGTYFGPGHTNGDAMYLFDEANVVHMGDLLFNKRHPFVDRSAGANIASWITVLDKAVKQYKKDTIFIFGHSLNPGEETGTVEDLKKFGDYLSKVLSFAEAQIKAGKSKEEFIKNTSIPGVTEWTGQGIERPLTAAYEELTEKKL
ncbi:MAG TPA: MBL fold metallo-hydrolase [Chitinophagaceae bacterium]|nr:MBL fold metallo-hydrolase [Chitinophagaceae bacterium]